MSKIMDKKFFSIFRGHYGCSNGVFVCVTDDLKQFKKLMNKKHYIIDDLRQRFYNDNTRVWYRFQEIDIVDSDDLLGYFESKFEDICDSESFRKRFKTIQKPSRRLVNNTSIKGLYS